MPGLQTLFLPWERMMGVSTPPRSRLPGKGLLDPSNLTRLWPVGRVEDPAWADLIPEDFHPVPEVAREAPGFAGLRVRHMVGNAGDLLHDLAAVHRETQGFAGWGRGRGKAPVAPQE